ncbi:uncharacterized protein LOC135224525 [Macrobrachium nipponense]|uniref:uncharacterized protein LOC135224525 n=1 Tax=Macrobrachium nipponense TaxID=159736 RepID=UPI0030C847BE
MQPWRLLIVLEVLFVGYGIAEMMPDFTESTADGAQHLVTQEHFQTEVKKTTDVHKGSDRNLTADIKGSHLNKSQEIHSGGGPFRSHYQALQRHHHLHPAAHSIRTASSSSQLQHEIQSSLLNSLQISLGSSGTAPRPVLVPSTQPNAQTPGSGALLQNKTSEDDEHDKRHLKLQRGKSYHQLTPRKVITTEIPSQSQNPEQSLAKGIQVKPKGHSSQKPWVHSAKPGKHCNSASGYHETKANIDFSVEKINQSTTNGHSGRKLDPALLQVLIPRDRGTSQAKLIQPDFIPALSDQNDILPDLKEKKIVKKNVPKVEANIVAISGIHYPPGAQDDKSASPSVPVVIVTTQMPFIQRVMHKKLVESRSFKSPRYMNKDLQAFHDPLHSMYGPPYDHYKFSAHKSLGGSFPPTKLPFYQSDKKFLQEHIVLTEEPRLLPEYLKGNHSNYSKTNHHPSREEPIYLAPSPPPSVTPRTPASVPSTDYSKPPKEKAPKVFSYKNTDDTYLQPLNHPNFAARKTSAPNVRGKSISAKKDPTRSKDYVARYSAISDGVPGVDYPIYSRIPYTSFACKEKLPPGIYGDAEAGCQVWHICEADGRQHSFLCPNGTIFNQELLTCDWWYNVHCGVTEDQDQTKPDGTYRPQINNIPLPEREKLGNSLPLTLPNSHQKPNWSTYSSPKPSDHPVRPKLLHTPYPAHFTPPPPLKRPMLSPRGSQGLHSVTPIMPPTFLEFQPYYKDTYPMFHLRKRHAKKI